MGIAERVTELVAPLLAEHELSLFDLEYNGGVLRILVSGTTASGMTLSTGVDLDRLASFTRATSRMLDEVDPIPGRYSLEISTPGLERPLRTEEHFAGAVGEKVNIKTIAGTGEGRRLTGELLVVRDRALTVQCSPDGIGPERPVTVSLDRIERARTVFEWGPKVDPKKKTGSARKPAASKSQASQANQNRSDGDAVVVEAMRIPETDGAGT